MTLIKNITGRQILDSRGNPTVEVDVALSDGSFARSSVPSGASTGMYEAVELRDNNNDFMGKSVYNAINNINGELKTALINKSPFDINDIDQLMINLDGTDNKGRLGANAILAVSISILKAAAVSNKLDLYKYIANISGQRQFIMPTPMMNIINGGCHADNNVDIQEFMICPIGANSFSRALQMGAEVFHNLKLVLKSKGLNTTVGDEGGFAPNLKSNEEAIEIILEAIEKSNYTVGSDVVFALDVAATELYHDGLYVLKSENKKLSSVDMIDYYETLCNKYPIVSIEDGLSEDDWKGWKKLTNHLGRSVQLVGDDLTVTNANRLKKAINENAMNAILIKLNQIGTVTETLEAINVAKDASFGTIISHRSGETSETIIADLAVGTCAGQIKTGSLCRTDRVAKYNQLLRIEERLGNMAVYSPPKELLYEK